jgi:hypothetical protein
LSRRIGRSQNGVTGGWSLSPAPLPPWSADAAPLPGALAGGAGFGRARPAEPPDRCLAPAAGQPLAGQAGAEPGDPEEPEDPEEPPARPRTGVPGPDSGPGDAALGRDEAADRPAPRDQPEAGAPAPDRRGAAGAVPPDAGLADTGRPDTGPADTGLPDTGPADLGAGVPGRLPPTRAALARDVPRGGRSSGGAVRLPSPSASAAFLSRAEPAPPAVPASRRVPVPPSPPSSTGGGASGRSRDA